MVLAAAAAAFLFVSAPVGPTLLLLFLVATLVIWARGRAAAASVDAVDDPAGRPFGRRVLLAGIRAGGLPALLVFLGVLALTFSALGAVPGNWWAVDRMARRVER
jgi:hypothetical protein